MHFSKTLEMDGKILMGLMLIIVMFLLFGRGMMNDVFHADGKLQVERNLL